jgi:CRP-like cAMP-binding protein
MGSENIDLNASEPIVEQNVNEQSPENRKLPSDGNLQVDMEQCSTCVVSSELDTPCETDKGTEEVPVAVPEVPKTRAIIERAISRLNYLNEEQRNVILDLMYERKVNTGEVIVKEGDRANQLYVIESGKFQVSAKGISYETLEARESFNDFALLRIDEQYYTVTAVEPGNLWTIDRENFSHTIIDIAFDYHTLLLNSLRSIPSLSILTDETLFSLAAFMDRSEFSNGQVIVRGDFVKTHLYIIKSGEAILKVEGKDIKKLYSGDYFLEPGRIGRHFPQASTIVANGDVKCFVLSARLFGEIMGGSIKDFF